jgi:hypothetical protein
MTFAPIPWARALPGACLALALFLAAPSPGEAASFWDQFAAPEVHGFLEARAGVRTQDDPYEKTLSVGEARLQGEAFTYCDWGEFKYKGDLWFDGVTEQVRYDTREAWIFSRAADFLDIKLGRQVLTWGTGDLVFLNDLFPKDWQSFFIGRDDEYLKAPSDSVKTSLFLDEANVDFVYTPLFDSDRFVTGEYLSYWNSDLQSLAGRDDRLNDRKPKRWFADAEYALRLYKNYAGFETALYGYWGFWKSPGGQTSDGESIFPRLNVYGGSIRGPIGAGIGNVEIAYYDSTEDASGANPLINNSQMRYLAGYAREICTNLTGSVQYYIEQILDYSRYRDNMASGRPKDEFHQVVTLQITQLLLKQDLELTLSAFYSPNDQDAYIKPKAHYKYTDNLSMEIGANLFFGEHEYTTFGQYHDDTNVYTALRYSF